MKVVNKHYDGANLRFECEPCEDKYLDTQVFLNGNSLCWCSFPDVENFANEFFAVIDKYRI